ncbi:MAG TPA: protein kinase [Pyrinomonadaceae bacterium]|nr:protein kinase [Pyrinomonadaceae bacterium]
MKTCPVCGKEYSDTSTLCPLDAAILERANDPLIGQTLATKYLIERLIKRGGMGAVYAGKHVLMDKTVAIKVLHPSLAVDDNVVRRFSREAKAASRISHPHAVIVTDFGESENGVVFLVMEYLDGRTLKEVIRSEGPMNLNRAAEIVRQVAGALDAAHEQGVVHRDLKSDNIMLSKTNGGEWAKVLDFGIAKIQESDSRDADITAANLVIGTPQYMSPEQCSQSAAIDARTDVYSLGVILYEMLAGQPPFTGDSPTVIMMRQVQDPPPSILATRPEVPVTVAAIIEKALAKQPGDRYQTAGALSSQLNEAVTRADTAEIPAAPVTVANPPVAAPFEDDEATLVRARELPPGAPSPEFAPLSNPLPQPAASVRPWRILAPAAIVLVAVFALVFFLTRGSSQNQSANANVNLPGLVVDPNSQPVQPMGTPTGESERNIQPQPIVSATPQLVISNANLSTANTNSRTQETPATVVGDFGSNSNRNVNLGEAPTPRPTPRKADSDSAPSPKPTASVRSVPKPTASPIER